MNKGLQLLKDESFSNLEKLDYITTRFGQFLLLKPSYQLPFKKSKKFIENFNYVDL